MNGSCKSDMEQMLLDFAYSDTLFLTVPFTSTLLRQLATGFGNVPRHPSLLHSILAIAAAYHPENQSFEQFEYHEKLALRTLERKTRNPADIVEADAFGACLLAFVLSNTGRTEDGCFESAVKCCTSVLPHLLKKSPASLSGMFHIFAPFIIDTVAHCHLLHAGLISFIRSPTAMLGLQTCLKSRIRYEAEFKRICSVSEAWQSPWQAVILWVS
jgi:hypothetical protein